MMAGTDVWGQAICQSIIPVIAGLHHHAKAVSALYFGKKMYSLEHVESSQPFPGIRIQFGDIQENDEVCDHLQTKFVF